MVHTLRTKTDIPAHFVNILYVLCSTINIISFSILVVYMDHSVFIWIILCLYGSFSIYMDHSVFIWIILCLYGSFCIYMDHSVFIWIIWIILYLYGSFCVYMDHSVFIWIILYLYGSFCIYMDHSVFIWIILYFWMIGAKNKHTSINTYDIMRTATIRHKFNLLNIKSELCASTWKSC